MKLDFTKLENISKSNRNASLEKKDSHKTLIQESFKESAYNNSENEENRNNSEYERLNGISSLQRKSDLNKAEKERYTAVYEKYQINIRKSESLRSEILKGLKQGEDIYSLFLMAAETVSMLIDDVTFYRQIEKDIKEIYGECFNEKDPIKIEINGIDKRLVKLKSALEKENDQSKSNRIRWAITEHEKKKTRLNKMLENGDS